MPKWEHLGITMVSESVSVRNRDTTEPGNDQVSVNLGKWTRRKTERKQKRRKTETKTEKKTEIKTKTQTVTAFNISKRVYLSNSGRISRRTSIRLIKLVG